MENENIKRKILLTPGPATTTEGVKYSQVVPDICPREKEFGELIQWIRRELTCIVGDNEDYATVLFGGSGTAAIESMICSSLSDNDKLLVISNGAYGKRICRIAEAYGLAFFEFKSSPKAMIDLDKLEQVLVEKEINHLAVVHHETTTGLLNDVASIGAICRKLNISFLLDAISSFASIPINMKEMHISFLAASSNKNLQGMPGVSFVIANKKSLDSLANKKTRCFYLNLYDQYQFLKKNKQFRFTPPVQTIYALKQALIEFKKEGLPNRYLRYAKSWEVLVDSLKELGLKMLLEEDIQSKLIVSVVEPESFEFEDFHDFLYEKGITVYPGKLTEEKTFRIGTIGDIDHRDMKIFTDLMQSYFKAD